MSLHQSRQWKRKVQQARVEMGAWIQGQLAGAEVTLTLLYPANKNVLICLPWN
jgi:hypothetical protein